MFDYAMDLGTSSVLLYRQGKGMVLREPSVLAVQRSSGQVVCAGTKARDLFGRTPEALLSVRPIRGGVITDCEMTGIMAKAMLKKAGGNRFVRPNLLVCVPPLVSELEERAVIDAGMQAGASRVYLMEQPVAAAIGAGIDPKSPKGTLIADIGAGTTDIAVLSMGAVVRAASVRLAGDSWDDAIRTYVREQHGLDIGLCTAETIKCTIGGVLERDAQPFCVRGRTSSAGRPACVQLHAQELIPLFQQQVGQMAAAIERLLECIPPELVGDLTETGLMLCGGGAHLYGIDSWLEQRLGLQVQIAEEPECCAVQGAGRMLGRLRAREDGTIHLARRRQGILT